MAEMQMQRAENQPENEQEMEMQEEPMGPESLEVLQVRHRL